MREGRGVALNIVNTNIGLQQAFTVQYIVLEIGTAGAGSLISNIDQEINLKKIGAAARRREITVQFPKSLNFLGVSAVSRFPRPDFQGNILYCMVRLRGFHPTFGQHYADHD